MNGNRLSYLTMRSEPRELKILLVEDDELDVMGIRRALQKLHIVNPVTVASDGIEALDILRGGTDGEKLEAPYIIFLDINMPRMNGIEFLDELRKDDDLKDTQIFILTVSNQDDDIYRAYQQNVAGYIVKSDPTESLKSALQLINCGWLLVERRSQ